MNDLKRFVLFLCCVLPLSLFAQSDFVGSWKGEVSAPDGSSMTFSVVMAADGSYKVDFGMDGSIDIKGKYEEVDGKMTIQDVGGPEACSGKGVYQYAVSGNSLTMTRVSDECEGRGGPEGKMMFTKM